MSGDDLERLERLSRLLELGHITREEFEAQKERILRGPSAANPSNIGSAAPPPSSSNPRPAAPEAPAAAPTPAVGGANAPGPSAQARKRGYAACLTAMVVTVCALLLIPMVMIGGPVMVAMLGGMRKEGLLPMPAYKVVDVEVNDGCTRLTDYCVRVSCVVQNVGPVAGTADVEMQLLATGDAPAGTIVSVSIPPGESRRVSHDFTEARLTDDHRGSCTAR